MNSLINRNSRLVSSLSLLLLVVLLQSCCLGGLVIDSSVKNNPGKKPCNCYTPPKQEIAVKAINRLQAADHTDGITVTAMTIPESDFSTAIPVAEASIHTPVFNSVQNNDQLLDENDNSPVQMQGEEWGRSGASEDKKLPLGIKGISSWVVAGPGISFKKHDGEDLTNYKRKAGIGIHIGFGSTYYFSDRFAFSPSIHYKQMRAGGESTATGEAAFKETYTYNYLSAPLLAEVNIGSGVSAFAGPELNYLLSGKSKIKYAGQTNSESLNKSSVKFGVGIQAGIKYSIPDTRFGVQLLYDHRISRVNKKQEGYDDYGGGYEVPAIRMSGIQLGVVCSICSKNKD